MWVVTVWINIEDIGGGYAGDSSRTAETELYEIELGFRAAFGLYHFDDCWLDVLGRWFE